jgi:predicted NBD/HSP70 family sugar kinase
VGKPLQKDLETILQRDVRIENDANCFAVSEAVDGAGMGARVVFGAIIGTGCGGGTAIEGKSIGGRNNVAGEWGHNPLPYPRLYAPEGFTNVFGTAISGEDKKIEMLTIDKAWAEYPGELCYCGKPGCQEIWISGTGFKKDYARVTGEALSTHDVIANAKRGEPKAVAAYERYANRLARALAVVINTIDPDVIVLGGGMSNVAGLYNDVPKLWTRYVHSDIVHTQLKSPLHGDSSGVRGAAWLWNDRSDKMKATKAA